ncbi:hypothetical protein D3C76_1311360 [compost metagenome]
MRDRQIIAFNHPVANEHSGAVDHINIVDDKIIAAVNRHRGVINPRFLTEIGSDVFGFDVTDNKVFSVLNMNQLATVTAGDVRHHKVLHGLFFRIVVIVGTSGEANADTPVDLAVSAVDVVDHVVRNQNIAIVNRHIPLNRIALQMAETAVGDPRAVDLIMESLAQNGVVSL